MVNSDNIVSSVLLWVLASFLYLLAAIYFPVLSAIGIFFVVLSSIISLLTTPFGALLVLLRIALLFFAPWLAFKLEILNLFWIAFINFHEGSYLNNKKWEGAAPPIETRLVLLIFGMMLNPILPLHVINSLYWTDSDADDIRVRDIPAYIISWSDLEEGERSYE